MSLHSTVEGAQGNWLSISGDEMNFRTWRHQGLGILFCCKELIIWIVILERNTPEIFKSQKDNLSRMLIRLTCQDSPPVPSSRIILRHAQSVLEIKLSSGHLTVQKQRSERLIEDTVMWFQSEAYGLQGLWFWSGDLLEENREGACMVMQQGQVKKELNKLLLTCQVCARQKEGGLISTTAYRMSCFLSYLLLSKSHSSYLSTSFMGRIKSLKLRSSKNIGITFLSFPQISQLTYCNPDLLMLK